MPKAELRSLEEIFRAGLFNMLKEEGKITDEIKSLIIPTVMMGLMDLLHFFSFSGVLTCGG